jgi:hypothetical protein
MDTRVYVGFEQVFDHGLAPEVSTSQKGSIELVGEFFKVRAQVDRDLTTVSWVDRQLGLIKNLGCHSGDAGSPNASLKLISQ